MGRKKRTFKKLDESMSSNKGIMQTNNQMSSKESDVESKPSLDNNEMDKITELPNSQEILEDHKFAENHLTDEVLCNSVPSEKEQHGNAHTNKDGFYDKRSHSSRTFRRTEKDNSLHGTYDNNRSERHQKHFTVDDQRKKSENGNYYHKRNADFQVLKGRNEQRPKVSNSHSFPQSEHFHKNNEQEEFSTDVENHTTTKEMYYNTENKVSGKPSEEMSNYSSNNWRSQKNSSDNSFTETDKMKNKERYDNNEKTHGCYREKNKDNSEYIESDIKHYSFEKKYPSRNKDNENVMERKKGYQGSHNDDQSNKWQTETSSKSNINYNRKNHAYTVDNNINNNKYWTFDQTRRGRGWSENKNWGDVSFQQGQGRGSYRKDMGDRRSNEFKPNYSQNSQRNSSNFHQEGTYKTNKDHSSYNANSRDFSNQSRQEPAHNTSEGDWNNQAPVPNAQTQQDDVSDNTPVDDSSWYIQNVYISVPDAQGATSSNLNDSIIDAPEPVNQMTIISPDSSTLNPHASSFHVSDGKKLWSDVDENEAPFAEAEQDQHRSEQLKESERRVDEKYTALSAPDNIVNRGTSVNVRKQLDGASRPLSNKDTGLQCETPKTRSDKKRDRNPPSSSSDYKQQEPIVKGELKFETLQERKNTQKKERHDFLPDTSRYKQKEPITRSSRSASEDNSKYGAVASVGSTLSVDQNASRNSELSWDETRSELSSQQDDGYHQQQSREKKQKNKPRASDGRPKNDSYVDDRSPRYVPPSRRSMSILFDCSTLAADTELADFKDYLESDRAGHFVKVTEEEKDLFTVGEDYSLAHCVAEDMNMGSGIAVEFRRKFKQVPELLKMKERSGGLAILEDKDRFIYYMVTKKVSSGKPTYDTFWNSLKKLRNHMQMFKVSKLAIPRIGCGLDRLEWNMVKAMVEFAFMHLDVHILVCNFQQGELNSPIVQRSRKCRIVNESYPIREIDQGTIIVYFASADGQPTQTMTELDKKFNFLPSFKRERRNLGDCVRFEDRVKNYILYGCIVKERKNDQFDFVLFAKSLSDIQRNNKKDGFGYVGFQKAEDDRDDLLNDKVLNIISHSLRDVDIYCCNSKASFDPPLNDSLNAG